MVNRAHVVHPYEDGVRMKRIIKVIMLISALVYCMSCLCACNYFGAHTVRPYEDGAHIVRPYENGAHAVRPYEDGAHAVRPYDLGPGLHIIRNPENYTQVVIDENGNMIDRTINSDLESISLINNPVLGYAEYYYKTDFTAEVKNTDVHSTEDMDEVFDSLMPIQKSKLYDKHGNEIKLPIEFSNAEFATSLSIFLRDANQNYYDKNLVEVYQNTDGTWSADSDIVYENTVRYKEFTSDTGNKYIKLYFSTELYDGDEKEHRVVVTDDSFIKEREYKGYNLDDIIDLEGKKIPVLIRLVEDKLKYNFLDDNNDLVFDEDVDKGIPYDNKSRIVTLIRGDKEFDFSFDTFTTVGDSRVYIEKVEKDPVYELKEKYEDIKDKIVSSNDDYKYATIWYDEVNKKIRILANKDERYDELTGYTSDVDVYDEDAKLLGTMPKFSACYEENGYFFYNNNTVCDFDLNIIKTFDDDMYLSRAEKFNKSFFIERFDIRDQYSDKKIEDIKPFKIYDKDFNVLYDDIIKVYEYTLDDYLIVVDKDNTKFINLDNDGNLYVKKEISRPLDVSNWYSESDFKAFKDLQTGFFGILDKDLNIKVDNLKNAIDLKKDYFTYELGFSFGLMDYDGNIINKYSIFNTMGE